MLFPVVSEHVQCAVGKRQVTIFGAFAAMNVDRHSLGVNVADLQVESFFEPQPKRIKRPQKGRVVPLLCCGDQLMHFLDRQDVGQRFLFGHFQLVKNVPLARTGLRVEEFQCTESDFERARCERAIINQVQNVVRDLLLRDLVRRPMVVTSQLANFS